MNLGIITQPNTKGQIVIPKKFREELGVTPQSILNLTIRGNSLVITPLEKSFATSDSRKLTLELLKKTAGSWSGDDFPFTEEQRKKMELNASKNRKNAW